MEKNTFIYSQISTDSLLSLVTSNYDLSTLESCMFYVRGLHDNYLISASSSRYILRVYRNNWRSDEEIGFELELLDFLGIKGAHVAFPLRTRSGGLSFVIDCPEGKRTAALFHYANGQSPGNNITNENGFLLGKSVADIHHLAENFKTKHTRQILDIPYLLDESIIAIEPFVNTEILAYLKDIQNKLHYTIPQLPKKQEIYGICTGDVNPTNFHINENILTVFDFDQCGYGFRAFEIGKFISSIHTLKNKKSIANEFLEGYQQIRQLDRDEIAAIPYFEMVAVIWVMAININNADLIGYKWLEKPFWDRKIAHLKELDEELFINKSTL